MCKSTSPATDIYLGSGLLRVVAQDFHGQFKQTAFCRAFPGFKFKQVDFTHFKKCPSNTAVIAYFIVYKYSFNQLGGIPHL